MYSSFFPLILDLNICHYGGHCVHRVANLRKSTAANAPFQEGEGTPWMQAKSNLKI